MSNQRAGAGVDSVASAIPADERDLILQVAARNRRAFEVLYHRYAQRLYGYLWKRLGRREVVEEVLDDVMLVVWKDAARFNATCRLSTWIFGIAHNKALKALARDATQSSAPSPAEHDVADEHEAESTVERGEIHRTVMRALEALPANQRTVVELAFYHGRSYQEIAEIVGSPVNTIKTRMFHARRRLAPVLAGLAVTPLTPQEKS